MEGFVAKWVTPYLFWIKFGICALGAAAIFGAGMWLESTIKGAEIANEKADRMEKIAEDSTKALGQYHADVTRIHDSAGQYAGLLPVFRNEMGGTVKDLQDAMRKRSLPPDCVIDDGRLRALSAAVAATNRAAAGRIAVPAVPANR